MAERRQAETALQQAQKMEAVGQMTGGIAHDFNNLGNLDLASRRVQDEKIGRWLSGALQAAQRGAKLTGQLLAFARKQHLQVEPTDLSSLISGIGDLLVRTIGATVRTETSLHPGLWPVLIDASQVELIILNLALNARDAIPDRGLLRVGTANVAPDSVNRPQRLHLVGDFVCLTVSDTETGMSDEVLAKAFEPFFTTKARGAGTGLGLSQVYGITRQLGGHVDIESRIGEGKSFRIYLPRAAQAINRPIVENGPEQISNGAAATVLVVDDDPDVRTFAISCLESLGYNLLAADGGYPALAMLSSSDSIDLMLIDVTSCQKYKVPKLRGARLSFPSLRILFMTGYVAESGDAINRQQVLGKPFTVAELSRKVQDMLNAPASSKVENVVALRRKPGAG